MLLLIIILIACFSDDKSKAGKNAKYNSAGSRRKSDAYRAQSRKAEKAYRKNQAKLEAKRKQEAVNRCYEFIVAMSDD